VPLHWAPTDPQTRPVLTSATDGATLRLTSAQSGTSFDHLEIDNTKATGMNVPTALALETGVAATVRSSVVNGLRCVEARNSGPLTIEDSTLLTPVDTLCARLGALSTVRRSTVGRSTNPPRDNSNAVMETQRPRGDQLDRSRHATAPVRRANYHPYRDTMSRHE
jgi:hypothetical protein